MPSKPLQVTLRSTDVLSEHVISFSEQHRMGVPARASVRVLLEQPLDFELLLGAPAELLVRSEEEPDRKFIGIIASVELEASPLESAGQQSAPAYTFELVSLLELLRGSIDCRIFQDQDVRQIVSQVLDDHGIVAKHYEWRLSGTYPKREYTTQYGESALHFITRLLEAEGIYFFSELDETSEIERIIFADDSSGAEAMPGPPVLPVRRAQGLQVEGSAIYALTQTRRLATGKVSLKAFDFKRPDLDLNVQASADTLTELERYDFTSEYLEPGEGTRLAQSRLEALQQTRHQLTITSDCTQIHPGRKLDIDDGEQTQSFFAIEVTHRYTNERLVGAAGQAVSASDTSTNIEQAGVGYLVTATLIPLDVKFRLSRQHQAPKLFGPQTATVVAPEGAASEEIHTDALGRCKVLFHWDRAGITDDRASCWMRVTQLQTSGSMVLPRVGWEVVVDFLEGDPDQPYVTARLYNGMDMPPYKLPEGKTRSSLQTRSSPGGGGSNEIRFEDKAGAEEIMINSQYGTVVAVANNRKKNVAQSETLTITNDATLEVGANQEVTINSGCENSVGGAQTISVGGNRSQNVNAVYGLTVAGTASTTVGGNQMEMDGNPLEGLLRVAASKAADVAAGKVAGALGKVQAKVQGKVDAALGPITKLSKSIQAVAKPMDALANGHLGAAADLVKGAAALPTPGKYAASLLGGKPDAVKDKVDSTLDAGMEMALDAALSKTTASSPAKEAIGQALGTGSGGGGGSSAGNVSGPSGDLGGFSQADTATGPGHAQYSVNGPHTEETGALRLTAAAGSIQTTVATSLQQTIGAAHIEVVMGDRSEKITGTKSETAVGLIVKTDGDESESAAGIRDSMVGGAVLQTIGSQHLIESKTMVNLVGAMHKLEASGKIVFKCGASSVTIDGGGITIASAAVTMTAGSVVVTKSVTDV